MFFETYLVGTRGRNVFISYAIPHIFGGDFYAAFFCKRQQFEIRFGVFLCGSIIIGVDNAILPARDGGKFYRPLI